MVCRPIEPDKVFSIVGEEAATLGICLPDFYKIRCEAEEKARRVSKYEEITIDDIYKHFNGLSVGQQQELSMLEQDVEMRMVSAYGIGKEL